MADFLLFLELLGVIIIVVILVYIFRSITSETGEKHWYYIVYICEKYQTCQPDVKSEFYYGTPKELQGKIGNKIVQTIIKLD